MNSPTAEGPLRSKSSNEFFRDLGRNMSKATPEAFDQLAKDWTDNSPSGLKLFKV